MNEAHSLSGTVERGVIRARKEPSEAHVRSEEGRGRDLSGHGKIQAEQGALTNWRWEREGLVRTWDETDHARRTHFLEMAEGGTCQIMEGN